MNDGRDLMSIRDARLSNVAVWAPWALLTPRTRTIAYWVISAPVLLETIVGAQWDLTRTPYVRDVVVHLGYPLYLLTIMGVAKVLAALALLTPGLPRLKDWAYAGIFFVYAGAASSHFAVGDPPDKIVVPCVFALLTLLSCGLQAPQRHQRQE